MNARNSNLKLEHETHRYLAWHVAAFQRAKKLPSLKDWIYGNKNDKKEGIDAQSIKEFFQNYQAAKDYMECQE